MNLRLNLPYVFHLPCYILVFRISQPSSLLAGLFNSLFLPDLRPGNCSAWTGCRSSSSSWSSPSRPCCFSRCRSPSAGKGPRICLLGVAMRLAGVPRLHPLSQGRWSHGERPSCLQPNPSKHSMPSPYEVC